MLCRRIAGVTLTEVLASVGTAALVASVSLPSYSDYAVRASIPRGTAQLLSMHMQLEQHFQDHHTYEGAAVCAQPRSNNTDFDYSCPVQTGQQYLAQATGKGRMAGFVFTIDERGVMRTSGVGRGWRVPPADCWVVRKDGSC